MASGLLGFLGFGKQSKPNLTPNRLAPEASSSPFYGQLSQLAKQRINAGTTGEETPGVGFGADFVNKATNPMAQGMRTKFEQETDPFIKNTYAAKGAGYSSLADDARNKAFSNNQNAIDQLMSQFYTLNEQQKKSDITQGIQVGQQQDANYFNQGNKLADEAEAQVGRNVSQANIQNTTDRARQNQTIGSIMNMVVPGSGQAFMPTQSTIPGLNTSSSGVKTKLLGQSNQDFEAWLNSFLG